MAGRCSAGCRGGSVAGCGRARIFGNWDQSLISYDAVSHTFRLEYGVVFDGRGGEEAARCAEAVVSRVELDDEVVSCPMTRSILKFERRDPVVPDRAHPAFQIQHHGNARDLGASSQAQFASRTLVLVENFGPRITSLHATADCGHGRGRRGGGTY